MITIHLSIPLGIVSVDLRLVSLSFIFLFINPYGSDVATVSGRPLIHISTGFIFAFILPSISLASPFLSLAILGFCVFGLCLSSDGSWMCLCLCHLNSSKGLQFPFSVHHFH